MHKLNILVVENNPDDRQNIEMAIEKTCNLVASVSTVKEALHIVNNNSVDLVITELQIKEQKTGIGFVATLDEKGISCIITTAVSDQAVYKKIKKNHLISFLVKPFHNLTLLSTIDLASKSLLLPENGNRESSDPKVYRNSFFIKKNKKLIKILLRNIKWIQSAGNYSYIVTKNKKFVIKISLARIMRRLPNSMFMRIHRSYVINKDSVNDLNVPENIVHIDGTSIPVGRSFKAKLLDHIDFL